MLIYLSALYPLYTQTRLSNLSSKFLVIKRVSPPRLLIRSGDLLEKLFCKEGCSKEMNEDRYGLEYEERET